MNKPRLSFWQLFNMNYGFFGIQFGWGLQLANMSAVYERLGARPDQVPLLWLAAPMTGLLVQPIVGALSDRTWGRLGRRRPYFLTGAILASIALFVMPTSSSLWMAASLLWVLDASINISMEPFRAFVADKLDTSQRTAGFVMQSLFIGIGASLANALPFILSKLGVSGNTASGIPLSVKYSFQAGAVVFLLAVLWTVITTSEYPAGGSRGVRAVAEGEVGDRRAARRSGGGHPRDAEDDAPAGRGAALHLARTVLHVAVLRAGHGAARLRGDGPAVTAVHARDGVGRLRLRLLLDHLLRRRARVAEDCRRRRAARRRMPSRSCCGAIGLLSVYLIHDRYLLLLTMVGVGIAWASILSMPYAILSSALPPARMGVYMGVFNFFIVIPEIVASLFFGPLTRALFGQDNPNTPLYTVMLGGVCMLVAAALVSRVHDPEGTVPVEAVLEGDRHEPLTVQESMQPVPSRGAAR